MDILADKLWTWRLLASLSLAALCLVAGAATARYPPTYILALTGLGAAVLVAWWNRGVLAGILVLLLLEGVPLINTGGASSAQGADAVNDAIFVALVILLAACAFDRHRDKEQDRLATLAVIWASCYLAWWLFKVVAGSPGIPLFAAVSYGREFMGFAIFLPLVLLALRRPSHVVGFTVALTAGVALFSVGEIVSQVAHAQLAWLIHAEQVGEFAGVARIYAPMDELLVAAFPMSFAAMLLGPKPWRRRAMLLTVLTGLATALSLTRAIYVSELVALFLITLVWAKGVGWRARRIRHVVSAFVLVSVATVVLASATAGGNSGATKTSSSPVQAVVSRAALGVSDVQNKTGTVSIRLHAAHLDLEALGHDWAAGLGFLNPAYHWAPGLREGSIRDNDLGSLGIVMTMGLIGLFLAYMPPVAGLFYLLRRRRSFVQYGGAMYLSAALVGSITLATVSSVSGLLVLGSMLALCLNWTALDM